MAIMSALGIGMWLKDMVGMLETRCFVTVPELSSKLYRDLLGLAKMKCLLTTSLQIS